MLSSFFGEEKWLNVVLSLTTKGLEKQRLIGLRGAGFNCALTTTKASAPCVEARQDEYIKGICSPGANALILVEGS